MAIDPLGFHEEVLPHEREHIDRTRAALGPLAGDPKMPLAGLALSGGGIRSATFNLGILQALAGAGKLARFDYLSTVSGGGYIGSWLTAWIHRRGLATVQAELAHTAPGSPLEPHEVRWLRAFSNYLTPRKGLLSLDTLWGCCTYVRNLVINQLLLAAFVLAVLFLGAAVHESLGPAARAHPLRVSFVGMVLMLAAAPLVGFEFAHLRGQEPQPLLVKPICWLQRGASPWIIAGLSIAGAILIAYAIPNLGPWLAAVPFVPEGMAEHWAAPAVANALPFAGFWLIAWLSAVLAFRPPQDESMAKLLRPDFGLLVAVLGATLAFAWLQATYASLASRIPAKHDWLLALVGPAGYVTAVELAVLLLILFAGNKLRAHAHDWLSRMAAAVIAIGVLPIAVFAVWVLLVPTIDYLAGLTLSGAALAWAASTVGGVLGGRSTATGGPGKQPWWGALVTVTPYVFLVGIFAILGYAARALVMATAGPGVPAMEPGGNTWAFAVEHNLSLLDHYFHVGAWWKPCLGSVAALLVFASCIDVNLFSFHSYYRNRLIHAYLGASARKRRANAFTGYAVSDTVPMPSLVRDAAGNPVAHRPYPLVNTALNLTGSSRSEWQERKAASFVFSPMYSGFEIPRVLSPRRDMGVCPDEALPPYVRGFQPTADFVKDHPDRSIGLGFALTISGAAASPNMGYHTSKALAALMTVFNVRLGWWMPNPVHGRDWEAGGPGISLLYLLSEFIGSCHEGSRFVYLSDGGHFENLGVYELLRRRCPLIVACDAGADAAFRFDDLGNLVRKARVDLMVEISIDPENLRPPLDAAGVIGESPVTHVIGDIVYPPAAGGGQPERGTLVYVKSSVPRGVPADVDNYRRTHPGFPHQSTGDQWFDEGQFESYRRLGLAVGERLVKDLAGPRGQAAGW
jgi:hypothetical protein